MHQGAMRCIMRNSFEYEAVTCSTTALDSTGSGVPERNFDVIGDQRPQKCGPKCCAASADITHGSGEVEMYRRRQHHHEEG